MPAWLPINVCARGLDHQTGRERAIEMHSLCGCRSRIFGTLGLQV